MKCEGCNCEECREKLAHYKSIEDDFDVLSRFLIAYLALPPGSVPKVEITPAEAYITLTVEGTKPLRERLERFIKFGGAFLPKGDGDGEKSKAENAGAEPAASAQKGGASPG